MISPSARAKLPLCTLRYAEGKYEDELKESIFFHECSNGFLVVVLPTINKSMSLPKIRRE